MPKDDKTTIIVEGLDPQTKRKLTDLVTKYSQIEAEVTKLKAQIEQYEKEMGELKDEIINVLDLADRIGSYVVDGKAYIIKLSLYMQQKGISWKDKYELAYSKLNGTLKKILDEEIEKAKEEAGQFMQKRIDIKWKKESEEGEGFITRMWKKLVEAFKWFLNKVKGIFDRVVKLFEQEVIPAQEEFVNTVMMDAERVASVHKAFIDYRNIVLNDLWEEESEKYMVKVDDSGRYVVAGQIYDSFIDVLEFYKKNGFDKCESIRDSIIEVFERKGNSDNDYGELVEKMEDLGYDGENVGRIVMLSKTEPADVFAINKVCSLMFGKDVKGVLDVLDENDIETVNIIASVYDFVKKVDGEEYAEKVLKELVKIGQKETYLVKDDENLVAVIKDDGTVQTKDRKSGDVKMEEKYSSKEEAITKLTQKGFK